MEVSLDARYGTSDEFYDPYCDSCFEDGRQNIRAHGFCTNCVQFLCTDCYTVHGRLQGTRNHDVVQGEDMPKSQADKPPRFECCDVHPKLLKNQFCCDHKILLCPVCSSSEHNTCATKNVEEVCPIIDTSDTGALYDKIRSLQETLKSTLPAIDKAMMELKVQEKTMLHDAQMVYDQIITQAKTVHGSIKNEIQKSCQSQITRLSQQRKKVSDMNIKLDTPLTVLGDLKAKPIDTKLFLRLQENVNYTKNIAKELQELRKSLNIVSLSFIPSQPSEDVLSSSFTLGKIRKSDSNLLSAGMMVPDIMFPVSALKQITAESSPGQMPRPQSLGGAVAKPQLSRPTQSLLKMKVTKQDTYNVKNSYDRWGGWITGMAITNDRRILMVDFNNNKVKMLSQDMKFLSSVSVPYQPWDIAVISEREAVITTTNESLVILDISGSHLSIKTTARLSYDVGGISRYNNNLIVTSPDSKPSSVKLIDQTGRVYWSVSSDQQGQPLFSMPLYVSSSGDGRSSTVIVTDRGNHTLTSLNGDTGEIITRRQLKGKDPVGVTTDSAGNFYVCYRETSEVAVLSGNLSEERILLSTQDGLSYYPLAIAYDDTAQHLILSYDRNNKVERYKLS